MRSKNDFSQGSIAINIVNMAIPMTIAQLINILYSVVDRMYLGRLPGHLALTGLGLCLPIISIIIGFANLCGMGGAPLCSIYRGKGEDKEAEQILGNSFILLIIFGMALTVLGMLFRHPILYLFGASKITYPYANDYITIYLFGTNFVMIGLGLNPFINSQGFSRTGMATIIVGAVINIILDPIFIFLLDFGVRGAALATVIAQGCSALWVLKFLTGKRSLLKLRCSAFKLQSKYVKKIISLGMSGFIIAMTNSLVQILCNASLEIYSGDLYVGIMTVINSIREIITMPIQGITNGSQPVLGYNYGARCDERVCQGIRFTTKLTVTYSFLIWLLVMLLPEPLIRIFNSEATLINAGVPVFRVYFCAFFCMAFQFVGQSTFIALGHSSKAIFFSLLRKAFIVAPLTLILPIGLGVDGVFLAEPISNILGGTACIITMYITIYRPLMKGHSHKKLGKG